MNNRIKTPGILRYTCRGNRVITGSGKKLDTSPVKVQASDLMTRRNRVIRPIAASREEFSTATLSNTGFKATTTPTSMQFKAPCIISEVDMGHGDGCWGIGSVLTWVGRCMRTLG